MKNPGPIKSDTVPYFYVLDGLRGIAALSVLAFHLMEAFSLGNPFDQVVFNHGYLAVDFFFLLSGFIIAHTYDQRWNALSIREFAKRRFLRLHPMLVIGMTLGLLVFFAGTSSLFPKIKETSWSQLLLVFLWGSTLLPLPPRFDIRGWSEMHPLNGPAWSLFFEYLANAFYAVFLKRVPLVVLAMLTLLSAGALLEQTLIEPRGDVVGGWSLEPGQFRIGLTRLAFPFLAGILLKRSFSPIKVPYPFLLSALALVVSFSIPRLGGESQPWMNGLFESLVIMYVFPCVLLIGTGANAIGAKTIKACQFLGDLSYPLYITHYPLIYIFTARVHDKNLSLQEGWLGVLFCALVSVTIALICLKFIEPHLKRQVQKLFALKDQNLLR